METTAFFPLRTNAHALLAGGPAQSVVRRIKRASLLHDQVLLESGTWRANAGPHGSSALWVPPHQGEHEWQAASERGQAQRAGFYLAMGPSGSARPLRKIIDSDSAEIAWQSTFEPLRNHLPGSVDWVEFESFELTGEGKRIARRLVNEDVRDDWLARELHEIWSRKLVAKSVAHDLVLGTFLDSVVSMDDRHALVTEARVRRGVATVALGGFAQSVLLPDVATMNWDDLATIRRDSGLQRLREVLKEIEAEAREGAESLGELENKIRTTFDRELARAASTSSLSRSKLVPALVGFIVGEGISLATAGVPGIGGVAGAATGAAAEELMGRERRWVRAYTRIVSR